MSTDGVQADEAEATPFTLPPVMDGYPLDNEEQTELDRVLKRFRRERETASDRTAQAQLSPPPRG